MRRFLSQFRASLEKSDGRRGLRKLEGLLTQLEGAMEPLSPIPVVGGYGDRIKKFSSGIRRAIRALLGTSELDIHGIRDSIRKTLLEEDYRILVIIDDIDRLSDEDVRQVFQIVKCVADFPKTIYLLVFDRHRVASALNRLQEGAGEEYVEKIVQVAIAIPLPDRIALRKLLSEHLEQLFADTPSQLSDQQEWGNLWFDGVDTFMRTPRNVKRLVNNMRVTYPPLHGEVRPIDFVGIQTLRVFCPELYAFVSENRDSVAGVERDWGVPKDPPEKRRDLFDSILKSIPDAHREAAKNIMSRLFPRWSSVYGGMNYGNEGLSLWRKERRVCSPDIFDLYFQLSPPPGDISLREMRAILEKAGDPAAFSAELLRLASECRPDGKTRVNLFLDRIQDYTVSDIPSDHIESILRTIYQVGDDLILDEDRLGIGDWGNDILLGQLSRQLLMRIPSHEGRFHALVTTMSNGKAVRVVCDRVLILGQEHGKYGGTGSKPDEDRLVAKIHLPELEKLGAAKIREAAGLGTLKRAPGLGFLLYRWRDWGSPDEVFGYVRELTQTDEGLTDYISAFVYETQSSGLGDRVSRHSSRVNLTSVELFIDQSAEPLVERVRAILTDIPEWLDDKKGLALHSFLEEIENPRDEMGSLLQSPP